MKTQYSRRVDRVVYGDGTDGYTTADWVGLAVAALDQADVLSEEPLLTSMLETIVRELRIEESERGADDATGRA